VKTLSTSTLADARCYAPRDESMGGAYLELEVCLFSASCHSSPDVAATVRDHHVHQVFSAYIGSGSFQFSI